MDEKFRPKYHFTPPKNWMNDPNGLVYHNGEYHLFYQHNPFGKDWGHMSWGHAVSEDLIHWRDLPVAIPEEPENGFTIFSGSAVVDVNNSSGFGRNGQAAMIAVYTADYHPKTRLQSIHAAYSVDSGRTFTKYTGNPVLNVGEPKFGDPKVFWHSPGGESAHRRDFDTAKWIMVNILGENQGKVVFHNSSDLKAWRYTGEFAANEKVPGKWECPDLFPLAVDNDPNNIKWILKVNSTTGSVSKYFIGIFDGQTFYSDPNHSEAYDLSFGDIYAEATWNNIPSDDGRRILIGWIQQSPCECRSWTGAQSIPRALTLRSLGKELRVCQLPISEMKKLRSGSKKIEGILLKGSAKLNLPAPGKECEIITSFEMGSASEFGFQMHFDAGNDIVVGYSHASNRFFVTRTQKEPLKASSVFRMEKIKFHIFIDGSIIEVFVNHGEIVFTLGVEPGSQLKELFIYNKGEEMQINDFEMWELDSGPLHHPFINQEITGDET